MEVRLCEKRGQPADFRTPLALKTKQFCERKSVAEAVKKCWGQSTAASALVDSRELREGRL